MRQIRCKEKRDEKSSSMNEIADCGEMIRCSQVPHSIL